MKLPRRRLTWEEVERETNIQRTEPVSRTSEDITRLERKMLGLSWGKKRRKYTGPR